ncbi:peptide methionine sulfoxide reductase-like [Camellia sinensis]|uniref:peptide methionine sulfoxide reductase-like n=1 Tax=Camellia sinensis TaxID=4442 RepID=UPI001036ED69|nr:peptide methionine sulfoxide reductase-like [Camellia sinensis]
MYKILSQQPKSQYQDDPSTTTSNVPSEFLSQAVFAGESFWGLEAAYGRVDGVVKTVTGYCGGTLRKPTYREVREGRTGHTEAVKVTYDKRKTSYRSLCDAFWETHDPTNKDFLNFGISTHQRSVIFYKTEEEKRHAQESKIRRQMKLNRRIVTKIIPSEGGDLFFFVAENQHQKYYLQKHYRLCESLGLRSTDQFSESNIASTLNGILAMEQGLIADQLATFVKTHGLLNKTKLACEEIIEDLLRRNEEEKFI